MELEQQTKFDLLVRQLEHSARQQTAPKYQMRVALIAAIGYGYIWIICLALFSSLWIVRWLIETTQHRIVAIDSNFLWVLCGLVAIATFWVQYTPLKDREIHRADSPELFALIDELRLRLNAPKIHHVVINYDHNASIYQTPRCGWFGYYRNYLLLGLPLMQSLSPEQFKATLAHEIAHLASNDNKFIGWIFRVRQMWEQLTADRNLLIFQWFFRWYEPVIKAHSFVLLRDREYAADAIAKQISGREITASDLIQTYIYQYYLQEYFHPQLDRQVRDFQTPPENAITQMLAALRQPLDPQTTQIWLGLILGEATDTDDTHPCLRDRLAAVGYSSAISWIPQPILHTAAEYFFGDRLADLATELDLRWYENRKTLWLQQYQQTQYQREYLATLNHQAMTEVLTLSEATSQAELTSELFGESLALPLWEDLFNRYPYHPQANYQIGKISIDRGDRSGCVYLNRAIDLDPELVIPSCEKLYHFYTLQADLRSAKIYLEWRQQHLPKQWRSRLERKIEDTDRFSPHDLEPDLVNEIRNKLVNYPIIDRAYLVRKLTLIFPDWPLYILGLKLINLPINSRYLQPESTSERYLCDRLKMELNLGQHLIIATFDSKRITSTNHQDLRLINNIEQIPHASIF
jgi:Zn-dependent protease with chaperone function